MDQVKIGKFISECRKKNNLTQDKLAELADISSSYIKQIESTKYFKKGKKIYIKKIV